MGTATRLCFVIGIKSGFRISWVASISATLSWVQPVRVSEKKIGCFNAMARARLERAPSKVEYYINTG
jgi:hypothetical protein